MAVSSVQPKLFHQNTLTGKEVMGDGLATSSVFLVGQTRTVFLLVQDKERQCRALSACAACVS